LSPTISRLEDLLVSGSPKNTSKVTILEDKFVARDVANDKDVAKVSEEKEGGSWFFREWLVLGTSIERCEGSSPFSPTNKLKKL